ncbi:MAG: AAA family ATPase [bacterium]|nr:AAA family ATPase [bacterium]
MTVFLDEAQNLDCFKSLLNGYLRKPNLDQYFTGSNAKFLFQDVIKEFAGREDEISMHPLSLHGFMNVYPGNVYHGFSEYLIYGGIPSVALESDVQERADLLRSLFREIYLKGIDQRNAIRKSGGIIDLLNAASSSVGLLTNPEKRKNAFRTLKKAIFLLRPSNVVWILWRTRS